jgi:acylphosphatase
MSATERRIVRVRGRVQGVFFRASARREAERLGVAGFARNEPDGSVTLDLEGSPEALDAMVAWAHDGPANARVDAVDVESAQSAGRFGFETS